MVIINESKQVVNNLSIRNIALKGKMMDGS